MLRSVNRPRLSALAWTSAALALLIHCVALVHALRTYGPWMLDLRTAASLLGWTLGMLACVVGAERRNRVLATILLLSAGAGAVFTGGEPNFAATQPPSWELTAHVLLSMGAAALLFAAAATAVLLLVLDRRLRDRRIADLPNSLPPVDQLEAVLFRLIGAGFALLTLALFTGFVFVTNLFAQHLIHKTVLSVIAWVLFGVLLIGRVRFGWRGRQAVRWTLFGFALLVLSYFGSKFVLETVLGRHWG
ncbi:MAG: cytochrome c biogenesis protein CcsA [Proteobacteria bacterium]|nr:cytochrome c biogenesis protein CcsA [Pseudomonadota bacterium]